MKHQPHRIVIVGGGAGGLELATRLGRRLGRKAKAAITLVDANLTHLWKPLLHEVAAGTLEADASELDYLAHAKRNGFQFQLGRMQSLDRLRREVWLAPIEDEQGQILSPKCLLHYDTLVMAVGSEVNDFNTPGVREHAMRLNTPEDAKRFHRRLIAACLRTDPESEQDVHVVVIGAGATGVELVTELDDMLHEYGRRNLPSQPSLSRARITLIEAAPRILSALPATLSVRTLAALESRRITVLTAERVIEVGPDTVRTASGKAVPAQLVVWAAGIKAADFLRDLGGLETNKINQLVVDSTLRTTRDEDIFAFGDCADCPLTERGGHVPPLAQAAHQQALFLAENLEKCASGAHALAKFQFQQKGSLVTLGTDDAIGTLRGGPSLHGLLIEGWVARLTYWALYRRYLFALHGLARTILSTLGEWLVRESKTSIKLHCPWRQISDPGEVR